MVTITDLFESHNYENMFNDYFSFIENNMNMSLYKTDILTHIKRIRKILKKNDRIVWYLRWYKAYLVVSNIITWVMDGDNTNNKRFEKYFINKKETLMNNGEYFDLNKINDMLIKETIDLIPYHIRQIIKASSISDMISFIHNQRIIILNELEHYFSLPIPKIQNYIFNNQLPGRVLAIFSQYEDEWKKSRKGKILIDDDYDYEIIKEFPDNWYWIKLDRYYCELEANAMGHCGNSPGSHTDRILSLRKLVNNGKVKYWEPHLTFILDENGYLGEMKGRGNDKPSEKYNNYIFDLLEMPIIKGIKGGGFLSENNFSIDQLSNEQKERLIKQKSYLFPANLVFERFGVESKQYKEKLKKFFDVNDISMPNMEFIKDKIILQRFENFYKFLEKIEDRTVYQLYELYNSTNKIIGDDITEIPDGYSLNYIFLEDIIEKLSTSVQNKLKTIYKLDSITPLQIISNRSTNNIFLNAILDTSERTDEIVEKIEKHLRMYIRHGFHFNNFLIKNNIGVDIPSPDKEIIIYIDIEDMNNLIDNYNDGVSKYTRAYENILHYQSFDGLHKSDTFTTRVHFGPPAATGENDSHDIIIVDICYSGLATTAKKVAKEIEKNI